MKRIPKWRLFVQARSAFSAVTDVALTDLNDVEGKLDDALTAAYRLLEAYGHFEAAKPVKRKRT